MVKITTDSPYYKWASEIMSVARVPQSCVTMRIAELLEANVGDWIDAIDWCDDCDQRCTDDCDREPRYNEGYL